METQVLDFFEQQEPGKWIVYAKNSYLQLGMIEWSEKKNAYDYFPNANGKLMKVTQQEEARRELVEFCRLRTQEKLEQGGNR